MKCIKWTVPVAVALVAAASAAFAQQPGPPSGPGPGPGMGPGMMQGPGGGGGGMGPGRGMGPGGGSGPGGGMGPGPGGGMGPGSGMMGPGGGLGRLAQLDLSESQRSQVFKIQDELRRKNWDLLGKSQDEQAKLRDAYFASGTRDRAAIVAAQKRIGELRVQQIENALDAAEKIEAVLTPQQRDQLKRWGPWWIADGPQ